MRIVLAPDSFKSSLSAAEAVEAMAAGVRAVWPAASVLRHPMADGGEGTLAAIAAALPVQWQRSEVCDLNGQPREVAWLRLADGAAVLESAEVVGLGLARVPVAQRHSLGLGQLLRIALAAGCRRILLGLGGTGSNDGGAGLLVALGARLLDANAQPLAPTPEGLARLARLDLAGLMPDLAGVSLLGLADVASPLAGEHGASRVFGPQKGLLPAEMEAVDARLRHLGELGDAQLGYAARAQAGSGAAGGLGWALRLLGAELAPGAEVLADLQGLSASLAGADYLLTGEGRADIQTTLGKLPWRMAARAGAAAVPAVLFAGQIAAEARPALATRFASCHALAEAGDDMAQARQQAAQRLQAACTAWARQLGLAA